MARIFPDMPLVSTAPEIARVHRLLKNLPDGDFTVWHRLSIHTVPGPDFWILHATGRSLWLKVSTLTPGSARVFGQPGLFDPAAVRPAAAEHQALLTFAAASVPPGCVVPAAVVFPGLGDEDLARLRDLAEVPSGVQWASGAFLRAGAFPDWVAEHLGTPLTFEAQTRLRQAFAPEVVIPASFTVRSADGSGRRKTTAALTPYLLDYDQERVLKTDLDLSPEAGAAVSDFKVRLVNGVAGSGKSLVIVYRAQILRKLHPRMKILGLTHNRALIHDLQTRYKALADGGKSIEWLTFLQWCRGQWLSGIDFREPLGLDAKQRLIGKIWRDHLSDGAVTERMFQDELDWCKDRLIFSCADYLAADRSGRGFPLTETQRERIFAAFDAYQVELNAVKLIDWGDVPRQIWRWVSTGQLKLPQYDAVLIDEAQFFAPIWFEIIKRIVKPRTGHLFLVADPTQGFLKRRQSWLASGLDVRGRAHTLKHSYRTTREILSFATLLYRTRLPQDDDDIVAPDLFNMPTGLVPQVIPLTSAQDETTRVVGEIGQLLAQGVPPAHLLVIAAEWRGRDALLGRLRAKLGPEGAVDPVKAHATNAVRVCTLNAATGLESPIVFLTGVHTLFEEEQSVRLSEDERHDLIRDNTRKLYMALTRAGQRVVLTYVGEPPEAMVRCLTGAVEAPVPVVA